VAKGVFKMTKPIKTLPWGEEIYLEVSMLKKSLNKFYAVHGKTADGKEYIELTKFGPKPNTENESYRQKLRIYNPAQWAMVKHYVEGMLADSAGWDIVKGQAEFEAEQEKAKLEQDAVTA
jgi:hypothetical protein